MSRENDKMVESLKESGFLTVERFVNAFKKVDRAEFVPESQEEYAYLDRPLSIGKKQTISAPSMVAIMTEQLNPEKGEKILEVGTGSGYQTAILAELAGEKGKIYTIERLPGLAEKAKKNLQKYKNIDFVVRDGTLGYEEEAPYDKIIVTAGAPEVPDPLVEQLKEGGVMAIPVGSGFGQRFILVKKDEEGEISEEFICGCAFVPLVGEHGYGEKS
ncbi:MAG: protein-L-isoaspartate(D-aspartate) O-methyltransferase [Candidatus Undinarchaeales archaeon]